MALLEISQNAMATQLTTSQTNLIFNKSGGIECVTYETDGCSCKASHPKWLEVYIENGSRITINCQANDGEYRTGTITLKEDNLSCSIYVTQEGVCDICHGGGRTNCSWCNGQGGFWVGVYYSSCSWCGGQGSFKCSICNGTGTRK